MEDIFKPAEKRRVNKVLIVGALAGLLLVGAAIWIISFRPSFDEQKAQLLEGAHKPGSPEFDELNKDIIISTDEKTVQSPTARGTISMYIHGNIRNKGTRTIETLEVNVAVVTQFNDVLRERRMLVVPVQQSVLSPGDTIPITITLDGFDEADDRANIRWRVTAIKAR